MIATVIDITGNKITLTLSDHVQKNDMLTLAYIKNIFRVQDLFGNEADNFDISIDTTGLIAPPVITSIEVGTVSAYSWNVVTDIAVANTMPDPSTFSVPGFTFASVSKVGSNQVEYISNEPAVNGASYTGTYTMPAVNHLQGVNNNYVVTTPTPIAVTNNVPATYDPASVALFARISAAGETMTDAWKTAMNTYIVGLKANALFETQWDSLVIYRGFGDASTKMNIIANNINAIGVNNPTRVDNVGYNSNGISSYINTKFRPSVDGVLYTRNDAGWVIKETGTVQSGTHLQGTLVGGNPVIREYPKSFIDTCINGGNFNPSLEMNSGYNGMVRINSTTVRVSFNSTSGPDQLPISSTGLSVNEIYLLRLNHTTPFYCPTGLKLELEAKGKSFTQAQFNTFQSLTETFFATYQ